MPLDRFGCRVLPMLGAAAAIALVPMGVADASRSESAHDDDRGPRAVLKTTVAASQVADPSVFGVRPGTTPWVMDRGSVRLTADGVLRVRVRGLVIPVAPANSANPVPTLGASVFCNATLVKSTDTVPFDTRGNAVLVTDVGDLPSPCVAPAVLVHPDAVTARYIAFGGSR